jgi:phosphate starvation-inducible PhoH-like protein
MKEPNRERKNEIKYNITLNEEQKEVKRLIRENQIVIITGRAGSGKSLVSAQCALDFLFKKECDKILVTRAAVEVGSTLGFLPGSLNDKFDPYLEAFKENLIKCYDKVKIEQIVHDEKIVALPVQFIRGKTVDDILVVEEAQNLTKAEMLAILTRLGKTGKIIINGDNEQTDITTKNGEMNGLSYAIELSKKIKEIKYVKLKENHRSDLVGKILDCEYKK